MLIGVFCVLRRGEGKRGKEELTLFTRKKLTCTNGKEMSSVSDVSFFLIETQRIVSLIDCTGTVNPCENISAAFLDSRRKLSRTYLVKTGKFWLVFGLTTYQSSH